MTVTVAKEDNMCKGQRCARPEELWHLGHRVGGRGSADELESIVLACGYIITQISISGFTGSSSPCVSKSESLSSSKDPSH